MSRCDKMHNEAGVEFVDGVVQHLIKDQAGQLHLVSPDTYSTSPFKLLSNTAETTIEMSTVQQPQLGEEGAE